LHFFLMATLQETVREWLRCETKGEFRGQGGKLKTTGDVAVAYIEGVLGLPTQILGIYSRSQQKPILGQPPVPGLSEKFTGKDCVEPPKFINGV